MSTSSIRALAASWLVLGCVASSAAPDTYGLISGRVRFADGTPLADANVYLSSNNVTLLATTGSDGSYTLTDAVPGSYRVCTGGLTSGSIEQCFDHIDQFPGTGYHFTPVLLDDGGVQTGIDFDLSRGGSISGRMIDAFTGLPLANQYVGLSADVPSFNAGLGPAYVVTDADGGYRLEGIPAGDWYIVTQEGGPYADAVQIWPDVPCNETGCDYTAASLVTVVDGEDTPDIDFAFHPDVLISGRVTDATTGAGLANITVDTFWAFWLPFGVAVYPMTTTQTTDDGSYVLYGYGNDAGDEDTQYYVASIGSAPHIDVAYPDHAFMRTDDIVAGTPMTLHHGDQLTGIDLALPLGSAIAGTVYDIHTGRALPQSYITLFKSDATILWTGLSDDAGRFTTPAWTADTYYLGATWYQGGGTACGIYQDRPCPLNADPLPSVDPTPLTLMTGEIRTGVDFHLNVDVILSDSFDGDG